MLSFLNFKFRKNVFVAKFKIKKNGFLTKAKKSKAFISVRTEANLTLLRSCTPPLPVDIFKFRTGTSKIKSRIEKTFLPFHQIYIYSIIFSWPKKNF